jgi:hypothetical protein
MASVEIIAATVGAAAAASGFGRILSQLIHARRQHTVKVFVRD